jgi:hypothetical protein
MTTMSPDLWGLPVQPVSEMLAWKHRQPAEQIRVDFVHAATMRLRARPAVGDLRLWWFAPDGLDGLGSFDEVLLLAPGSAGGTARRCLGVT